MLPLRHHDMRCLNIATTTITRNDLGKIPHGLALMGTISLDSKCLHDRRISELAGEHLFVASIDAAECLRQELAIDHLWWIDGNAGL